MSPRSRYRTARRAHANPSAKSFWVFLLVSCFGIMFAGCTPAADDMTKDVLEEFTFTDEQLEKAQEMLMGEPTTATPVLVETDSGQSDSTIPVLDLSMLNEYDSLRRESDGNDQEVYRITNEFLNVRTQPRVNAEQVIQLNKGDEVTVLDFTNAAWAHVKLASGEEGYVASRYIAKPVAEADLADERTKYEGQYFVNFGFLNVRKEADSNSQKLGELNGQAIVRPLSMDDVWARVTFEGTEGYVAVEYLKPFTPNFLVRQQTFNLPVLHYRLLQPEMIGVLTNHITALRQAGAKVITLSDFLDLLREQQERDVRLEPNSVVVAVSDVSSDTLGEAVTALRATGGKASFFIQTNQVGIDGITQKMLLDLIAAGHDVQSAGHTGDDLRSLTNSQVELELKQSRKIIEDMIGKTIFAVAYPLGGVNSRVKELTQDSGYLMGLSAATDTVFTRRQLLMMPTVPISSGLSAEEVVTKVIPPPAEPS